MEYTILKANDVDSLIELVNLYITKGWVPQGGVSIAIDHYAYFYQAMIKI